MDTEGNNEYDWGIIEKNIRRIYGNKAYRRITEDEWWRYKYDLDPPSPDSFCILS